MPQLKKHIVIVGGGAGGLELAVKLGRRLGKRGEADITLVDRARTHVWKPLLHQVAAGTLDSHAEELEYLALARRHHFRFRLGELTSLDRERREIRLAPVLSLEGEELIPESALGYDMLVIAVGSQSNDFNTPGARENCIFLDSPQAAQYFHRKLVDASMRAQTGSAVPGEGRFTVAIIGGGATGVELAAELHMTARIMDSYGLQNLHPERDLKITILDAAPRILPLLPERVSGAVAQELRKLDIDIHTNEKVVEITAQGIRMASGKFIPGALRVWAAGIKAPEFLKNFGGLQTNRINQILVDRSLRSVDDEHIFAFGDCAACPLDDKGGALVPPRAQAAHQQASMLASSIPRILAGKSALRFSYKDHGSLVSLGEYSTVGSLMGGIRRGSVFIEGLFAKCMYWSLHKQHQVAINGGFRTWLATWVEAIDRIRNPRIKLH
ncbi:MAG: FAD-dependent oxidoreductase [Candidatus Dactylopiibacterium carminicum]|uniref:FAD-dependent oxidoreductase n=1 Tax=Candidatus Dactylopiibacterium carminicum TaxID=857335 RepID=A0A272EVP7_9RHOO|nr:NAD(P)/FAD-dependent oxidoreductase [Candidatus Dactylopiibacterium carminicum]KAF7599786.1 NAD(P)/FAD-dependent oxidoreductase [Candidatus Dactylopiibacterium carminicum]PAS93740.1 MAG: FAD-dependent oxidoreductase [Candidatus Dactylopiibacterium carminicum]PAS98259.1 MAG: FAD-dependent oxidoreductase [Candidatus Dactylopiibacterium carminicum]PAS99787.1 MAG: FAD-dependent oxidoreductase [Candidatus Dactylopiibacterium carminicum]